MSFFSTNSNLFKPLGFPDEFGQIAMWTASGPLALHALHALHLTGGFAEADVGVHVRSIELMDFPEIKTLRSDFPETKTNRSFWSGCEFTGAAVRWEDENIYEVYPKGIFNFLSI
jgi:hypothetical protein